MHPMGIEKEWNLLAVRRAARSNSTGGVAESPVAAWNGASEANRRYRCGPGANVILQNLDALERDRELARSARFRERVARGARFPAVGCAAELNAVARGGTNRPPCLGNWIAIAKGHTYGFARV